MVFLCICSLVTLSHGWKIIAVHIVYSTYKGICILKDDCQQDVIFSSLWNLHVPPKVQFHSWRVLLNHIPTRKNLAQRGISMPNMSCPFCLAHNETTLHIFFSYTYLVWSTYSSWLGEATMFSDTIEKHEQN